jgi:hypothetical protein
MLFVGDRVRTPDGEGFVEEVSTWRDRIVEMTDAEAREFSALCRRTHGPAYQTEWVEVIVRVGNRARRYDAKAVTVLEGRDDVR